MDKEEETSTDQPMGRWFIAPDWFQQHNRSFSTLVNGHLCPKCASKLNKAGQEITANNLLSAIRDCCSLTPDFITDRLPILESVFRLLLANGNQPLEVKELIRQLSEKRSSDLYRTSSEVLLRLLKNDQYYGFQEAKD